MCGQESQDLLLARIIDGRETPRDIEQLRLNFVGWIIDEWQGSQYLALAHCNVALAEACGHAPYLALPLSYQEALLWFFSLGCPRREWLWDDARAFVAALGGLDELCESAEFLAAIRGG